MPTPGGEAGTALACLERTAPLVPGPQGIVDDTALRGVHHQTILRDLGLLPIKGVAAAKAGSKNARRDPRERRSEKLGFAETKTVNLSDRTTKNIDLYASGGAIGIGTLNADGELHFTPLPRIRTHRNADKTGYRWYNDHRLPDSLGAGQITVRLHNDAAARPQVQPDGERPTDPRDRSRLQGPVPTTQRR